MYRKNAGKKPIKLSAKVIGRVVYGLFASLVFGVGMSMTMVFEGLMLQGIIVGIIVELYYCFFLFQCALAGKKIIII